jgi:hypothetical protein
MPLTVVKRNFQPHDVKDSTNPSDDLFTHKLFDPAGRVFENRSYVPGAIKMVSPISTSGYICRRFDLSGAVLIFGGVLLLATVVCGAMEVASSPRLMPEDQFKVLRYENAIGPNEQDLVAMDCGNEKDTFKIRSRQCRQNGIKRVSH